MFLLVLLYGVMFVKCLLKAFALSMSVMAVLVLSKYFCSILWVVYCWIVLLWYPTVSVDCVCDEFCQDAIPRCLFVYVIVKSNDLWV